MGGQTAAANSNCNLKPTQEKTIQLPPPPPPPPKKKKKTHSKGRYSCTSHSFRHVDKPSRYSICAACQLDVSFAFPPFTTDLLNSFDAARTCLCVKTFGGIFTLHHSVMPLMLQEGIGSSWLRWGWAAKWSNPWLTLDENWGYFKSSQLQWSATWAKWVIKRYPTWTKLKMETKKDYELGINLNILNPMDYMFLQHSFQSFSDCSFEDTDSESREDTVLQVCSSTFPAISILVLIVLYCPGHVPSPIPYGHWSFTTRGGQTGYLNYSFNDQHSRKWSLSGLKKVPVRGADLSFP